jgi:hypothetical protein
MGTISTAIPSPEYQPLLDATTEDARSVGGFALAVLSRWMSSAQAHSAQERELLLRRIRRRPHRVDDTTSWGRALIAATDPGLPNLRQMAECSNITKDQYAFAHRGESGSVDFAARAHP